MQAMQHSLSPSPECDLSFDGAYATCSVCGSRYHAPTGSLRAQCKSGLPADFAPAVPPPPARGEGPGTELKALLRDWLGIVASPNCSCNARARQMDEWGPDRCEQNLPEIVSWLEEQAKSRGLPFVRFAGEQAVKLAIRRARKKARK